MRCVVQRETAYHCTSHAFGFWALLTRWLTLRKMPCVREIRMSKPPRFPARSRNRFLETELARAVRAARAAGGERVEVDPLTGKISVIVGAKSGEQPSDNDVESWLSKQKS